MFISVALLVEAMDAFKKVVPRQSTLAACERLYFLAQKNTLLLSATDIENILECRIPYDKGEDFQCAIDFSEFQSAMEAFYALDPDGIIEVVVNDTMIIRGGTQSVILSTHKPDNIDNVGKIDEYPYSFSLNMFRVRQAFNKTVPFVSQNEFRVAMRGVLFRHDAESDKIIFVSTEGHFLCRINEECDTSLGTFNIIVPEKGICILKSMCPDINTDAPLTISINDMHILFENSSLEISYRLQSRIIDDRFPKWEKVIPTKNDKTLLLNATVLHKVISFLRPFTESDNPQVVFCLSAETCMLKSCDQERNILSEMTFPAQYTGGDFEIAVNPKLLISIVERIIPNDIELSFLGPHNALLIEDKAEPNTIFILMPVRRA